MKKYRNDLFCLGLITLIVLALFPPEAFSPSSLLATKYSDAITQYLPHQVFIRRALFEEGRIPLWNPDECAGTPAFPNPLYPTLAFPHLLLTPLPPALALNIGFILNVLLAGFFAYACARQAGGSRVAALVGALVYCAGTRSLAHIQAGLYARSIFFAFIPLLFFSAERCLRKPGIRSAALMGLAFTAAILSGAVQLLIYGLPLVFLYSIVRARITPSRMPAVRSRRKSLAFVVSGAALSLLLTAFYILPALRLFPILTRARPLGAGLSCFVPSFSRLGAILNPRLLGNFSASLIPSWELALYGGIAPLVLISCLFFSRPGRRDLLTWGIPAAAAIIFSVRETIAIHQLTAGLVPPLASFRNPARLLTFLPFFLALLAARGLDDLCTGNTADAARRRLRVLVCVLIAASALLSVSLFSSAIIDKSALVGNYLARFSHYFGEEQQGLLQLRAVRLAAADYRLGLASSIVVQSALICLICVVIAARGAIGARRFPAFLLAILAVDLLYFGKPYVEAQPLDELYPPSRAVEFFEGRGERSRLLDMSAPPHCAFWSALPYYNSTEDGISRLDGYTPVNIESYSVFIDFAAGMKTHLPRWSITASRLTHPGLFSLLNTGFVLSDSPLAAPAYRLEREFGDVPVYRQFLGGGKIPRLFLYRNTDSLPRAWLVPKAVELTDGKSTLLALTTTDPRKTALVPPGGREFSGGEPFRPVPYSSRAANRIELECETKAPSYLVMSEVWAPGWDAVDNGRAAKVERVNGVLRGVFLDGGKHRVVMSYAPPGLGEGIAVSVITAAALCILLFIWTRRNNSLKVKGPKNRQQPMPRNHT